MSRTLLATLALLALLPSPGAGGSGPRLPDASDDPISVRFRWSAPADCSAHVHAERLAAPRSSTARIINFGEEPIRDVEVCAGTACAALERGRVVSPDEIVQIPLPGGTPTSRFRVRCSVLLPSAAG